MEENTTTDEADSSEEEVELSDHTDFEPGDGLEAHFGEAVNIIRTRSESFKNPEELYKFLFKYRDVLEHSSPVSGTLLHSIARTTPEKYPDIEVLAKRLIREHPQLLCETDGAGLTPVSMAFVDAPRQLVRMILLTCSEDPNCREALKKALQVPDSRGRTALHHLLRGRFRSKASLILKVLTFATDEALGLQDERGRTPLHYFVGVGRWSRSTFEVVDYFLARDGAMQESSRSREQSSKPIHTFLDVMDATGPSVYEHLYSSLKRFRKKLQQSGRPRTTPLAKQPEKMTFEKAQGRDMKNDAGKSAFMRPVAEHPSDEAANTSLVREDQQRLAGEVRPPAMESKSITYSEPNQDIDEISLRIAELIKLHYIRTRDTARASRFLYGNNTEDIQLYFNYTGGPAEVKGPLFEAAFEHTRFCDVLKFVAFPSSVSIIQDTHLASNVSITRAAGFGRRDMEFFSEWLQRKGVRHIIGVQVYDFDPCHSDKSIRAALQPFKIDDLDWRKIDLDPRTIQEACNEVRGLTLWWSGNNTTLRAWSEPTGLPALPDLKRIRICLPREIQAADSMACVENNIAEFQKRLQDSLNSQTGNIKPTDHDAINASAEGKAEKASLSASTRKARSIQVQFSASRALSTDLGEPAPETHDIVAPRRWLRCIRDFSRSFSDTWNDVLNMCDDRLNEANEPVVVALIDDGIDVLDPSIPTRVVHSGFSFDVEGDHYIRPWYASHRGHGTMVASLITWVCPMAQLFSIRVGSTERNEFDVTSLANALEKAIAKATIIVLGRGTNFPNHQSPEMDRVVAVLQRAHERGIILLRPLPGTFLLSSAGDSDVWQRFWGIIPARNETTHVLDHDIVRYSLVIPGTNAVVSHLSENNSSDFAGLLGVLDRVDEDDSSVATALAAGLISTLICCYKLIASFKALRGGPSANDEAERSLRYVMQSAGMEVVLKNLGDLTEDRVVKVWQTLDPVSRILGDKFRSVEEKLDQLVILTQHLVLGFMD